MRRVYSIVLVATLVVASLSAIACAGAAGPAATMGPAGRPAAGGPPPVGYDAGGDVPADGPALASPGVAMIIHTGSIALEVSDLRAAIDQATAVVTGLGGQVAASHEENSAGRQSASVTYRIPAERWTEAVAGLRGIAQKVVTEDTDAEDVTAQVVDLDARIANLRVTEAALQQIMGQATTIPDVLTVQQELTRVRADIESMTAQRDHLADQAALGTLTVQFYVPAVEAAVATGGWDLGREVDGAVATLVRVGQGVASLAVWLVIVVLPVLIPLALIAWVAFRIRRRYLARPQQSAPTV
jgi:hypothetical protein